MHTSRSERTQALPREEGKCKTPRHTARPGTCSNTKLRPHRTQYRSAECASVLPSGGVLLRTDRICPHQESPHRHRPQVVEYAVSIRTDRRRSRGIRRHTLRTPLWDPSESSYHVPSGIEVSSTPSELVTLPRSRTLPTHPPTFCLLQMKEFDAWVLTYPLETVLHTHSGSVGETAGGQSLRT